MQLALSLCLSSLFLFISPLLFKFLSPIFFWSNIGIDCRLLNTIFFPPWLALTGQLQGELDDLTALHDALREAKASDEMLSIQVGWG